MAVHKNFIAGEWIEGSSVTVDINPSDVSDVVGEYTQASVAQTETAIGAAKAALPLWSMTTPQQRADALEMIGVELLARKEEIGRMLAREEGKPLSNGIMETVRAAQIFKFFAQETLRIEGVSVASTRPGVDVAITREPVGVVGLICPWNFPIAIPAWKIAPALAYGNCVVFKPADLVPGTAWMLSDIISRSGLPKGAFNLVMGRGSVVGQTMLTSRDVNAVSFTGSIDTGAKVAMAMAARGGKFQLEMGGKNPLVVMDDANVDAAVAASVDGAFFQSGQRCTASSRLIVHASVHDAYVEKMVWALKALKVDHALKDGTQIGPVVDESQMAQDEKYIKIGREEGADLAWGGERLNRDTKGFYLSYDEALAVANDTPFGLSSGIFTSSLKYATDFRRKSQAGMVMVNLPTAGVDYHVPFGGRKSSSMGSREQGRFAGEFYTSVKTAYVSAG
jgi:alpha-ketoglutaric semialdehyde dehydrogenase